MVSRVHLGSRRWHRARRRPRGTTPPRTGTGGVRLEPPARSQPDDQQATRLDDSTETASTDRHDRAVLPLFGSAQIANPTATFVQATATVLGGTRLTLVVDDINPRYLYTGYDVASVRERWTRLAASNGCSIRFVSDTEPSRLAASLVGMLHRLRGTDLLSAAAPGLACRSRGRHTGYDAVHLATMALAADNGTDALLAVRGANLAAANRFAQILPITGLVVVTGVETPGRQASPGIVVDRIDLRAQLTSGMAERVEEAYGGMSS